MLQLVLASPFLLVGAFYVWLSRNEIEYERLKKAEDMAIEVSMEVMLGES